jgi:hypothetical protein
MSADKPTVTGRRSPSEFPWSDEQVRKAVEPRGAAIYDEEELRVLQDLAVIGAKHILARRKGGRQRRMSTARGEVRRMLVFWIFDGSFPGLPPRLRKTPTSPPTVRKVHAILKQCGWTDSEETVLKDIKKLGSDNLRGA